MATRSRPLTSTDALLDQQMTVYWEKALLGLVAAERAREAAAGGGDARAPWDVDVLPWSALILAALWDERRPLKGRDIDRWIASIGGRAGTSSMRTTLAQMATTRSPAGTTVLVKDGKLYRIGPDLAVYFTKRWGKFRPAELRWGLIERAVEDRGGGDIKAATDQQLANMTRTVSSREAREEIERRRLAGVWSGAVSVEGAAAQAQAPREFKYPGMRMAHDGTEAAAPAQAAPSALASRVETEVERQARLDREWEVTLASIKAISALPLTQRPKPPAPFTYATPRNKMFYDAEEMETFADMTVDQYWALTDAERISINWGYAEALGEPFNQYNPPVPRKWMTAKMIEQEDDGEQPQQAEGTQLFSIAVTTVEAESDVHIVYARTAQRDTQDGEPAEAGEAGEAGEVGDDPNEQVDDRYPDDIDVIYPTEDELAAIMRGEVVGPAAPEGFDTDPDDEG